MRKLKIKGFEKSYMILMGEVQYSTTVDIGGFEVVLELIGDKWIATYKPADTSGYGNTKEAAIESLGIMITEALLYKMEQQ